MMKSFKEGFGQALGGGLGSLLVLAIMYKIMVDTVDKNEKKAKAEPKPEESAD